MRFNYSQDEKMKGPIAFATVFPIFNGHLPHIPCMYIVERNFYLPQSAIEI